MRIDYVYCSPNCGKDAGNIKKPLNKYGRKHGFCKFLLKTIS
jgi:hypothetical protein